MPRRRGMSSAAEASRWDLTLLCGVWVRPLRDMGQDAAIETLEQAWELRREEMLADWRQDRPGERPWAWWRFDAGETKPFSMGEDSRELALARLRELGVVDDAEVQEFRRAEARHAEALVGVQVDVGES